MYLEYWQMEKKPFENTPDPLFFFHSNEHDGVLMKLKYVVEEHMGAILITGTFGCGKTLVIKSFIEMAPAEKYSIVNITNPMMDACDLLVSIARQLGGNIPSVKRSDILISDVLANIENILIYNAKENRDTLIVVDEAHMIKNIEVFETLRLLLNYQEDNKLLLTLILSGQPELRERIDNIPQLEQRIALKCSLEPLTPEETLQYILHRLQVAGCKRGIFTKSAAKLIAKYSGGIPRRINRICNLCLITGFGLGLEKITPEVVEMIVKEIETKPNV